MEPRYEQRKQALLEECRLAPEIFDQIMPRLERFMAPYLARLVRQEQVGHGQIFVQGLLSDLERKNVESIAYRFGQERMPLQWFIGVSDWDEGALQEELVEQVGQSLGEADGVIVFDPSAFPKSGRFVGGGQPSMVWSSGQGGQRPGGHLHGLGFGPRACACRAASFSAQRMDQGSHTPTESRCPQRSALSHPPSVVFGDVESPWR